MEKDRNILIHENTCERLKLVGHKGQTYDDIINELLDLKKKSDGSEHQSVN
jgi:hypothetical protein